MLIDNPDLPIGNIIMLLSLAMAFYWLVLRPQQQEMSEKNSMLNGLSTGDEVVTTSGIMGKVSHVADEVVYLSINQHNSLIVKKSAVEEKLPKGTLKGYRK
ncbi:MAG: preprotein translocase subunit YajC [Legionellales bacterium]|nr:preprotein translocase subunit YajC [Legionellales bacterium]|tara:strand:+ start:520 stop:822 length:303 start_codon:yes stop_codon:yes gene_type:complete